MSRRACSARRRAARGRCRAGRGSRARPRHGSERTARGWCCGRSRASSPVEALTSNRSCPPDSTGSLNTVASKVTSAPLDAVDDVLVEALVVRRSRARRRRPARAQPRSLRRAVSSAQGLLQRDASFVESLAEDDRLRAGRGDLRRCRRGTRCHPSTGLEAGHRASLPERLEVRARRACHPGRCRSGSRRQAAACPSGPAGSRS